MVRAPTKPAAAITTTTKASSNSRRSRAWAMAPTYALSGTTMPARHIWARPSATGTMVMRYGSPPTETRVPPTVPARAASSAACTGAGICAGTTRRSPSGSSRPSSLTGA